VTCVGIVANPASGRDIRRLVAGASVFGNAEKAAMVYRLLVGLGAAGVERTLMMPAADGLSATLRRLLRAPHGGGALPRLDELEMPLTGTAADSAEAVERMCAAGVAAIAVLGGDGTHRVVAKACGEQVPLCALSTGTNNAFPEMRETTVAGLATGLVATGQAPDGVLRREAALMVEVPGARPDVALVDVAVVGERFVGARALWRAADVAELFVTFANPGAIGLSAVAGMLQPLARGDGRGMHVRLADPAEAELTLQVPLAPGLVAPVGIAAHRPIEMGEAIEVAPGRGVLALDGEREIERRRGEPATVRLGPGPLTIDIDAVMRHAAHSRASRPA
jgi:predicted polyphosphate/ATP-dependent NAD kinase